MPDEQDNEPWPSAPLTAISVSEADYEALRLAIENPQPPTEGLKRLMRRYDERYGRQAAAPSQD